MKAQIADTEIDIDQMTALRDGQTYRLTRQIQCVPKAFDAAGGNVVSRARDDHRARLARHMRTRCLGHPP